MESEDSCLLSPSDPNTTLDQTQRSRKGKHEQMSAACPGPASPAAVSAVSAGARKRSVRCKVCRPRRAEDCGTCDNCLDKPKFGGPNKKKQTCINRKCVNMLHKTRPETTAAAMTTTEDLSQLPLDDIPVDIVGQAAVEEPGIPVIAITLPASNIEDTSSNLDSRLKRRKVEVEVFSHGIKEGNQRRLQLLEHDHFYSWKIPYFRIKARDGEMENYHSNDLEDGSSSVSSPDYADLDDRNVLDDEEDLTCREVMVSDEELDKKMSTFGNNYNKDLKKVKLESIEAEPISLNNEESLLKAIDNDIERLMKEDIDDIDYDFDKCENDYEYDQNERSPLKFKEESNVNVDKTNGDESKSKFTKLRKSSTIRDKKASVDAPED